MGLNAVQGTGASLRPGWGDGAFAHRGCVLLEDLCCQVKEQQEKVNRLHSLRSIKKELNWVMSKQEPGHPVVPKKGQAGSVFIKLAKGDSFDGEGWELMTSYTRRTTPAPPVDLQLQSRFSVLTTAEELRAVSNEGGKPAEPEPCSNTRRKRGRLSATGTGAPPADPSCCRGQLLLDKGLYIVERLLVPVQPLD